MQKNPQKNRKTKRGTLTRIHEGHASTPGTKKEKKWRKNYYLVLERHYRDKDAIEVVSSARVLPQSSKRSQLLSLEQSTKVDNEEKGLVKAKITHWRPNYVGRAVAQGHSLMTVIRLICPFKISLHCFLPDLKVPRCSHSSI